LLPLAALCACGVVKEKEPNDDYSRATPLPAGRTAQGTLGSPSDVDWYLVRAPREGVLSARLSGIREADWVLSIRGPDRTELKRVDETGIGGDEQALDIGISTAGLYVVVSNKNAKANNPAQPYDLRTSFDSSAGRERESVSRASYPARSCSMAGASGRAFIAWSTVRHASHTIAASRPSLVRK